MRKVPRQVGNMYVLCGVKAISYKSQLLEQKLQVFTPSLVN